MLEETARVVEQNGSYVWVEAGSRSACGSCGSCGTSVLGDLFKRRTNRLQVINDRDLRVGVGDEVIVGIHETDLVKAAVFAYMIPLLLLVATSITASSLGLADSVVMLLGALGLFAGLLLVQYLGRHHPAGHVRVKLLRRLGAMGEHSIQFVNLKRNSS